MKKSISKYFTKGEIVLWLLSVLLIAVVFVIFDRENYIYLLTSLLGTTSLIFYAKGNPLGPILMLAFSVMYAVISYSYAYYGEMITYLAMTAPMALLSVISWLLNPYGESRAQVRINRIGGAEVIFAVALTAAVTLAFYFILKAFDTANLTVSVISVATSFLAAYFTFRRSAYYALFYAVNDIVLIVLWLLASLSDISYMSVTVCFVIFLANDIYGFYNWRKMQRHQERSLYAEECL